MKAGNSQPKIALLLGRNKSTINHEVWHNTGQRGYRAKQACEKPLQRSEMSRNAHRVDPCVLAQADAWLALQWSPEQIAGKLPVNHETLYQHVYADKAKGGKLAPKYRGNTCAVRSFGLKRLDFSRDNAAKGIGWESEVDGCARHQLPHCLVPCAAVYLRFKHRPSRTFHHH